MNRIISDNKGFALILTMVISALMVAVVVELIHQVYVDVSLSRGYRDGQQASLYAESGFTGGIKFLQTSLSSQDYTSLSDSWAKPFRLEDETGAIEITSTEESGKINLNDLVQPNGESDPFTLAMLLRLGKRLQIDNDIWNALADWMDRDDQPRSNGAESGYYKPLKPSYQARNGKLTTFSELSLIKGFTPEIITKLRPCVTVYSGQAGGLLSQININTASKDVLAALDDSIDDRMAERIAEERRLKPFHSPGELSRIPGGEIISQKLIGKISVKGTLFRIIAIARVKESARTVESLVRLGSGAPETLLWQEY
jgi:general secretion pathway protein K